MSMARVVIMAVMVEGRSKSEVARDYGLSRRWVQTLAGRFEAEGEAAFEPRSRAPAAQSATHQPDDVEDASSNCASSWPRPAGTPAPNHRLAPTGARAHVAVGGHDLAGAVPPRIRHPQPHKRPDRHGTLRGRPAQRMLAGRHHPLAAGRRHRGRRSSTSSTTTPGCWSPPPPAAFQSRRRGRRPAAASRPAAPNGCSPTTAPCSPATTAAGLGRPGTRTRRPGIELTHCKPYHPQTCGKVERLHQTLKNWLTRQTAAATIAELQAQLDAFAEYYNTRRPTGPSAGAPPPQAGPPAASHPRRQESASANTSASAKTASTRDGKLTLRHASRLHPRHRPPLGRHPRPDAHPRTQHPRHHRKHRRTHQRPHPRPHPRLPTPTPKGERCP